MEEMRINSEDVTNWIAEKKFESIIDVYEWFENLIKSGVKICYYDSYIIDECYPSICFDNIEKFRIWKGKRLEHRKKLEKFINNYKKSGIMDKINGFFSTMSPNGHF